MKKTKTEIAKGKPPEEIIRNLEEQLRASEQKWHLALDAIGGGIWEWNLQTDEVSYSQSWKAMFGYGGKEISSHAAGRHMLLHPFDAIQYLDHFQKYLNKGVSSHEFKYRIRCKDNTYKWILDRTIVIEKTEQEKPLRVIGICTDISGRKRDEADIAHKQKMATIGTLSGGIAHDFNNMLGTIIGYAEMARDELPPGSMTQECIDQILIAGNRAKSLIQQIISFISHNEIDRKPLSIIPVIHEVIEFLRRTLPATIRVTQEINITDELILADPTQIHQVLMNLCTNAVQAMRDKEGHLKISLDKIEVAENDACSWGTLTPGAYLMLKVSDTGHGIASSIQDKIFKPFFTIQGEASGMGLAVVHNIVKSYGGHITVESKEGQGSVFTIYFPASQQEIIPPAEKSSSPIVGGKERILVVDDEDSILQVMEIMLKRLGYHVVARKNPLEALQLFNEDPLALDLIITDQTMPDLTGSDMAKKIFRIRPDLPIILCTGLSDAVSPDQAKKIGFREYMMKPVTVKDLALTIRNIFKGKEIHGEDSDH